MKQPANIFQRIGHALQEMLFALVKTAKSIGAESLHDTDVNVGIVKLHEHGAIEIEETSQAIEIVIEQLLAQLGGQIGLGIIQKRCNIILQRAFAAALAVKKKRLVFVQNCAEHVVAGLEVAIQTRNADGAQKQFFHTAEHTLELFIVHRD